MRLRRPIAEESHDRGDAAPVSRRSWRMDPTTARFVRYREHGDLDALGRVFDELAPRLLALAMHACGNAADAEDALQATFVVAMRKAAAFDATARVDGWLAGILAGEANNLRRRERRRRGAPLVEPVGGDGDGDPVAASERAELVAALRTRVESLPEEQRQVLLLQLQHGLPPAAIAEVLGVPPGTVRMRLHRGLAALRGMLPAGLAALLAAMLPSRGLAAVRAAVLREAVVVGGGVAVVGGLMAKKVIAAVSLLVLIAVGAWATALGRGNETDAPLAGVVPAVAAASVEPSDAPRGAGAADAAGESPAREAVHVAPGRLRVVVRGAVGMRSGRVTTFSSFGGRCMADVFVQVWRGACEPDSRDARTFAGRTDASGAFEVPELAPGRWNVAVTAAGTREAGPVAVIESGKAATVEKIVMLRAVLAGRVVDVAGRPVAGAEVWAGGHFDWTSPPERHLRRAATTRADGAFDCAVWSGELFVSARKQGFAASWSHPVDQLGDGPVTLELGDDPGAIVACVVSPAGVPIERATVCVQSREDSRRAADGTLLAPPLGQVAVATSPGRFVLAGLAPGLYDVIGHAPGWRPRSVAKVIAGASLEFTFTLRPGVAVRGHVRGRQGQPLPRSFVELQRVGAEGVRSVRPDDDGAFQFEGIEPGAFRLTAWSRPGGSKGTVDARVTADADVEHDIVVQEGIGLYGRVLEADGSPSAKRRVRVRQRDEREFTTGDDGGFSCDDLAHERTTVTVLGDGESAETLAERTLDDPDLDGACELVLPAAAARAASIRLRVVDENGRAILGAFVDRVGQFAMPVPNVDANGAIAFAGLAAGQHRIVIDAEGFAARAVDVAIAAHEARDLGDVVLAHGCELRVRFRRPDGSPWRERPPALVLADAGGKALPWDLLEVVRREVEADGTVVLRDLAAGRYTVLGPGNDELFFEPTIVGLGPERAASIEIPVVLRRRWTLAFDTSHLPASQVLLVTAQRGDGTPLATQTATTNGGSVEVVVILPRGDARIEASCEGRCTHAGSCRVDERTSPGYTAIDVVSSK